MEQAVKRQTRRNCPSLPLALLAAGVVLCFFGIVAASRKPPPQAAAPQLPEFTVSTDTPLITSPSSEAETPAAYVPDEAEVEMLARVLWGEARGVPSDMEKAAVVWCVLNRVDAAGWPDTVAEVVTQPFQFAGYSPDYPATEELKRIAADVLTRWERERREGGDVGRVLPAEYYFFTGDGERNYFRTEFTGGTFWDWTLTNPYSS
ncbi:hypothetical protein D1841_13070 [Neglecta sp. X4]|uniref:cell wall hydrolase n=1 Tax=unclassified Neglectibacter TaxID=2632164 RepID=UPI00136A4CD3|nr:MULTISPECIES: cell wall hydrolase [Eubacteriales]NBI18501.1 hypothetical protein [Neglectibacter sp. 59]NBJ74181.1 hypothetical protein [Neglectibacter sp. X4]NCE81992.1 hypothetical protein [Neglectibacter sp. X58]